MPVAQGQRAPARQALLVGAGAVMGLVAVLFLVTQMDRLTGRVDAVDLDLGDSTFRPGNVDRLSDDIAAQGPLFLPDLAGGDRDIILQHLGDDDAEGWSAFGVRPPTSPRDCYVEWQTDDEVFVDNCDGTEYPADGEGLPQYPVAVDDEGTLGIALDTVPVTDDD